MNWNPTPDEIREVERAHFRRVAKVGLRQARQALAKVREASDKRTDIWT